MLSNLTGKKVNGSGSFAATRGPVSAQGAQGYLQREVNKPGNVGIHGGVSRVGNDGKSDTRSGIAAGLLAKQRSVGGPITNGMAAGPGGPGGGKGGVKPPKLPPKTVPTGGVKGPGPGGVATDGGPGGIAPPEVNVNDAGQLELPYNAAFQANQLANLNQYNQDIMGLTMGMQNQQLEYNQNKRDLNLDYVDIKRDTLNQNATGGTAFSSQYGTAVGRNAQNFNNDLGDLESANTLFGQQSSMQQAAITAAFNQQMAMDALAYGESVAGDAGSLGLGDPAPVVPAPLGPKPPRPPNGSRGPRGPRHNGPKGPRNGGRKGPKNGGLKGPNDDWQPPKRVRPPPPRTAPRPPKPAPRPPKNK